jgi:hypothetical protein
MLLGLLRQGGFAGVSGDGRLESIYLIERLGEGDTTHR